MPSPDSWGIPTLDLEMQATGLVTPVIPYGALARTARPGGTVHFYVDDAKFSRLWTKPERILLGGYEVAVECNFSTYADMPRAEALWGVFKKRTLGRFWQRCGLKLIVDVNVEPVFSDLSLLGVPEGWRAYAARCQRGLYQFEIDGFHQAAVERAGTEDILFIVFGGGKKAKEACRERGWDWVPERSHVVRGIESDYGLAIA